MVIRLTIIISFLFSLCLSLSGQYNIQGKVTDDEEMSLPFVNIYIEDSSIGTTTNFDGDYILKLSPGTYKLVYQYIGFKTLKETVTVTNKNLELDVSLIPEQYTMPEVTISANAEDPAYAIIRKAQAKRKYYKKLNENYSCDAYVRGFNKIYKAPEKILGVEVGDLDGALDSTRQGVVYLSESVSKLYAQDGNKKEVMYSSKISGNDQGYSFNSAQEMDFDFYSNSVELNRKVVSPIGSNAMAHYKYKLEGAHLDEDGQLINKIKVIPKNIYGPSFHGYIFINENLWNINSLELSVTKETVQLDFIDTLTFKQIFIRTDDAERWVPFSNVINFRMGAFGFEVGGNFACVYSNYDFSEINKDVFSNEVFKVEAEANTKNENYWDTIRPIPLTREERLDYVRKDSIRIVRESPEYLDSIDKENNKFKVGKIWGGYTHRNSKKFRSWTYSSPLSNFSLNTVQGFTSEMKLSYLNSYNKRGTKWFSSALILNYGFSEKRLRPRFEIGYLANRQNNLVLRFAGGRQVSQFNRTNPISNGLNSAMTYFFRRNYMKLYEKDFLRLSAGRYLGNIFYGRLSVDYESRRALENNFDNSLFFKESRTFTPNLSPFENHQALILRASLRIKIGEKVWSYPDSKFRVGSNWPTIWIYYKKGIPSLGSDVDFDLIYSTISKTYTVGLWGQSNLYLQGGYFLNNPQEFIDFFHFSGNQTHIGNPFGYMSRFLMLPYYTHSTSEHFSLFHFQHNFQGAVLSKLPLFKKLGFHLVGGFKYLNSDAQPTYREIHIGLDNIGWKVFRLFRVDAVWNNWNNSIDNPSQGNNFGIVVGLKLDL